MTDERWRRLHQVMHEQLVCSFCGAKPSPVTRLIAGPRCYICIPCVPRLLAEGEALVAKGSGKAEQVPGTLVIRRVAVAFPSGKAQRLPAKAPRGEEPACSFCDKARRDVDWIVGEEKTRICDECVHLCEKIIAEESG